MLKSFERFETRNKHYVEATASVPISSFQRKSIKLLVWLLGCEQMIIVQQKQVDCNVPYKNKQRNQLDHIENKLYLHRSEKAQSTNHICKYLHPNRWNEPSSLGTSPGEPPRHGPRGRSRLGPTTPRRRTRPRRCWRARTPRRAGRNGLGR